MKTNVSPEEKYNQFVNNAKESIEQDKQAFYGLAAMQWYISPEDIRSRILSGIQNDLIKKAYTKITEGMETYFQNKLVQTTQGTGTPPPPVTCKPTTTSAVESSPIDLTGIPTTEEQINQRIETFSSQIQEENRQLNSGMDYMQKILTTPSENPAVKYGYTFLILSGIKGAMDLKNPIKNPITNNSLYQRLTTTMDEAIKLFKSVWEKAAEYHIAIKEKALQASKKEDAGSLNSGGSGGGGEDQQQDRLPDFVPVNPLSFKDESFEFIIGLKRAIENIKSAFIRPFLYPGVSDVPPKGIILYGPPGTGKTQLVRAAIRELTVSLPYDKTKVYLFAPVTSQLLGKYVGESEKLINKLFKDASDWACQYNGTVDGNVTDKNEVRRGHSVIFLDEVEVIAGDRSKDQTGMMSKTVNSLLQAIDGVESDPNVSVIVATNYPWKLDSAFERRFNTRIYCSLPDQEDIRQFLHLELSRYYYRRYHSRDAFAKSVLDKCRTKQPMNKPTQPIERKDNKPNKVEYVLKKGYDPENEQALWSTLSGEANGDDSIYDEKGMNLNKLKEKVSNGTLLTRDMKVWKDIPIWTIKGTVFHTFLSSYWDDEKEAIEELIKVFGNQESPYSPSDMIQCIRFAAQLAAKHAIDLSSTLYEDTTKNAYIAVDEEAFKLNNSESNSSNNSELKSSNESKSSVKYTKHDLLQTNAIICTILNDSNTQINIQLKRIDNETFNTNGYDKILSINDVWYFASDQGHYLGIERILKFKNSNIPAIIIVRITRLEEGSRFVNMFTRLIRSKEQIDIDAAKTTLLNGIKFLLDLSTRKVYSFNSNQLFGLGIQDKLFKHKEYDLTNKEPPFSDEIQQIQSIKERETKFPNRISFTLSPLKMAAAMQEVRSSIRSKEVEDLEQYTKNRNEFLKSLQEGSGSSEEKKSSWSLLSKDVSPSERVKSNFMTFNVFFIRESVLSSTRNKKTNRKKNKETNHIPHSISLR